MSDTSKETFYSHLRPKDRGEPLQKLRRCGQLETFSTARHHLGTYHNVGVAATYRIPQTGTVDVVPCIYNALKSTILEHPSLGVTIVNEASSFPKVYFARLPTIDLSSCVEIKPRKTSVPQDGDTDEELDALLWEQHGRGFDLASNKPIWRLIVLKSPDGLPTFTAAWFWHHGFADGTSALLFHDSFLRALNVVHSDSSYDTIAQTSQKPLPPALEELLPMPISLPFLLGAIAHTLMPAVFFRRPHKLWTGNRASRNGTFKFKTICLKSEIMTKLVHLCREERSSITAALQCLLAAATLTNLPTQDFDKVKITAPLALRRFLKAEHRKQMINAFGNHEYLHDYSSFKRDCATNTRALHYFSWDEARAVKSSFERAVAKKGRNNNVALLKYVSNMHKFLLSQVGKDRGHTAELSNIGVFKGNGAAGGWEIGGMTFSQSPGTTATAYDVNVVTGGDGSGSINFCWCEEAMGEDLMNSIIESLRQGIMDLVKGFEP